jgi:hypothetical protein
MTLNSYKVDIFKFNDTFTNLNKVSVSSESFIYAYWRIGWEILVKK